MKWLIFILIGLMIMSSVNAITYNDCSVYGNCFTNFEKDHENSSMESLNDSLHLIQDNWYNDNYINWNNVTHNLTANLSAFDERYLSSDTFFFLWNISSGVTGYNLMNTTISNRVQQTQAFSGLTGTQTLAKWINPNTNLTFIPSGLGEVHIHMQQTGGTKTVIVFVNITVKRVDNTEYELTISESSPPLTNDINELSLHAAFPTTILNISDRIEFELNSITSGGGSAPAVNIYTEGTTAAHLAFPVSSVQFIPIEVDPLSARYNFTNNNFNGSGNFYTTGQLFSSKTTITNGLGNNPVVFLNLTNNVTPTAGQLGQTADIQFNLMSSIFGTNISREAARISTYKLADWHSGFPPAISEVYSGLKISTNRYGLVYPIATFDLGNGLSMQSNQPINTYFVGDDYDQVFSGLTNTIPSVYDYGTMKGVNNLLGVGVFAFTAGTSNYIHFDAEGSNAYGTLTQMDNTGAYGSNNMYGDYIDLIPYQIDDTAIGEYVLLEAPYSLDDANSFQVAFYGENAIAGTDANMNKWTYYVGGNSAGAKSFLGIDNVKTYFGTNYQSSIYNNGTRLVLNAREVGTNDVLINSNLDMDFNTIYNTNFVIPRGTNNGGVGTSTNRYASAFLNSLNVLGNSTLNGTTITNMIQLTPITLPSCSASTNGTIARNSTKLYFCDGVVWNGLY